ncbi:MAG: dTDP-4-dehydrorhamnose reductase [Deltaproteobacteria bacterium]|nr:MAG: dTDP-4-dehydrorhamnose reductase [Deltaproteobacteria bacterium]
MEKKGRVVIVGAKGLVGSALAEAFSETYEVIALDREELDVTTYNAVKKAIKEMTPQVVIDAAGYSDVDSCERRSQLAFAINAEGAKNVAKAASLVKAKVVYISSDYVFDGKKGSPYTEEDQPNPLNIYGESKLLGEKYVQDHSDDYLIVRTQWLFGPHGRNFVDTILTLAEEGRESIEVVEDLVGAPTYTVDLAQAVKRLLERDAWGIYHVSNSGQCSWFEFAKEILRQAGKNDVRLVPISSADLTRPARRPVFSVLSKDKLHRETGMKMRPWQEALSDYLKRRGQGQS